MPTLKDLQQLLIKSGISPETSTMICAEMKQTWGGEKVYIPPPGSRKDPDRAEAIRRAAKTLPTGIVVQRFGVHRSYVYKITKK